MSKIVRRKYSKQFKADAVKLVIEQGYAIPSSPRKPSSTMLIFSSALYFLRVITLDIFYDGFRI